MAKHIDHFCAEGCPVEAALDLIGGKWKGVILYHLLREEKLRFGELKKKLPAVTQRMLTKQLREPETSNVVHREVFPEVPPRVEYTLTEFGRSLSGVIGALEVWGNRYGRNA